MREPLGTAGRIFGLDTEYGILVDGRDAGDLMEESRLLVRSYPGTWAGPWDYRAEDPRRDMRGFQVDRLNYDQEDARLDRPGSRAHLTREEERSDRALVNGARLYNDHGHPEYATPECRSLRDLVAHDRAGERILLECARLRTAETGREVLLFKNNTDFHGMSYGCHEDYLLAREVPFERLLLGMLPFLVTRSLYTGAGKAGVETGGPFARECHFQLSQRADFFTEIASVDTLAKRPLFNTRDEPHADPRSYRRLHVICGDANLSEFATALKVGTTCLVLSLLEAGWQPGFRLRDPVDAVKQVSRDPSWRWIVELDDGRSVRAVELQRLYLEEARKLLAGADPETDWTLREWERVLADLETDPYRAEDRLDWVAKRKLLETYIEAEGLWWEADVLRSLDLEYHNIDPELGLYHAVEGQMARVVGEAEIAAAVSTPPMDTRAAVRGELIRRFAERIARVSWGRIGLRTSSADSLRWVPLSPAWVPEAPAVPGIGASPREDAELLRRLQTVKTLPEAAEALAPSPLRGPSGEAE